MDNQPSGLQGGRPGKALGRSHTKIGVDRGWVKILLYDQGRKSALDGPDSILGQPQNSPVSKLDNPHLWPCSLISTREEGLTHVLFNTALVVASDRLEKFDRLGERRGGDNESPARGES